MLIGFKKATIAICSLALAFSIPVQAELSSKSDIGFATIHKAIVKASADEVFEMLVTPEKWWNKAHSWTGNADNFYMEAKVGGCFCELIPPAKDSENGKAGGVEHMRIIHIRPGKVLRLRGALGPLQSEAVKGVLTIAVADTDDGAGITFSYVVGGYMRYPVDEIGPAVDGVIGEQLKRLAAKFAVEEEGPPADEVDKEKEDAPAEEKQLEEGR